MLYQTILTLLILLTFSASAPNTLCNPSVQVMITQPISAFGTRNIITFPKAHIAKPHIAFSFINFQAAAISVVYDLWVLPGTGAFATSLTLTNYDYMVSSSVPTSWTKVILSFLLVNSSAEQFSIIQTFVSTNVKTNGTTNQKDTFTGVMTTTTTFNLSGTFILAAFSNGFSIRPLAIVLQWYRPGYILNFGLYNNTAIWFSIQAVQNTIITSTSISFLVIDTTIVSSTIYRFDKQSVYMSSQSSNITIVPVTHYDQYCVFSGINSFRYNYTVAPQFTFTYPTFVLTTTLSASITTSNYSINVTVVSLYTVQCLAPDIYYKSDDNLCYSTCAQPYYPNAPYCSKCHYTCKNCTAYVSCAFCLDTLESTKTLAGDYCNCNLGYFDNGLGTCSLCNSTCVSCSVNENNCTACHTGFEVNNTFCVEICGDGILYNMACDDGNIVSGDGCSSTCTVENNYTCINGTTTAPSVCSYNQPFQLGFISSAQGDSNIVYIQLTITPNLTQFPTLNFSQYTNLNLPFNSISHSYSSSKLNLTVNFTQPINTTYTEIIVSLTPPTSSSYNFKWQPSSVLVPYGTQVVLYYQISYSISNIVKIILIIVESLSFVSLVLSYRKMIVLQFIMVLQIITLSTSYIPQNYAFILTYKYLHQIGINGYNNIFSYKVSPIPVELSLSRLGYSPELFHNYNLMFILNLCIIFVSFILFIIQSKVGQPHSIRLQLVTSFIQNQILPTLILFSLVNLSFSIGQTANAYSSVDSDIFNPHYLSSNLSIMFASLFILTLLCDYYRTNKSAFTSIRRQYHDTKGHQLQFIVWVIYKFSLGFIMGLGHNYQNSLIALILIVLAYIIYTVIARSIKTPLLIVKHLYSQFVLMYLFVLLILYRNEKVNELSIDGMIPGFLLAALLVVGAVFVLIYGIYSLVQTIKICTKKTPLTKVEYLNNKQIMNQRYEQVNKFKENQHRIKRRKKSYNTSENSVEII